MQHLPLLSDLLRQQQIYILRIVFNLFGPAAGGFQGISSTGRLEEDETGALAGVAGQGFHAIGRFLIQLPVEDELIEPVKESQGSFCPEAPVLFQGFRQPGVSGDPGSRQHRWVL